MEALRELDEMLPEQPEPMSREETGAMGGRGKKGTGDTRTFMHHTRNQLLAQLKRDHPELAAKVIGLIKKPAVTR